MENAWAAISQIEEDPAADVTALIGSYQLKPHLLDAVLPKALRLLSQAYVATRDAATLQTIYVFSKVRGHKTIMQHLPTDAALLEPLLVRLSELNGSEMWQAQYSLLLWLASVVLTPFELENLGRDLWKRVYEAGMRFHNANGIQRDAAAVLIARLLTRKRADQAAQVDAFVAACGANLSLGDLQVLAEVMDRVSVVPPSIRRLVHEAMLADDETKETGHFSSMITSRLWIKIMGRVALRDIPEFAEFVLAECFALLDSQSTRVRMTAAKYIARITAKLPDENAEEVCTSLLTSLDEDVEYASPDYYNGALLALAEIVRRKLLHNSAVFRKMVTTVLEDRGLHFLQERLSTQIGTNVRDAACYVCWSLFRSVPSLDASLRARLFSSLVALAVLDHEVSVRRAAAAALQEGFGRYGQQLSAEEVFFTMEHINFQTVSLVSSCYLHIAPLFCKQPGFFDRFMLHGVLNANADMRRLAAAAIPKLRKHISTELMIDKLLASRTHTAEALHGKMLALGSLYTASSSKHCLSDAQSLVTAPGDSDLHAEAVLCLLPIAPDRAARVFEALLTEEKHVIAAAQKLHLYLPTATLYEEVLPICVRRMHACVTHVACLVAMPDVSADAVLQAARLPNPRSRAMAVARLGMNNGECVAQIVAALNDYSVDERGDVGAWVREAAVDRVVALRAVEVVEITDSLWKMASGSREKLRLKAGKALVELGHVPGLEFEDSAAYYCSLLRACPASKRAIVSQGVAASIGGFNANATTAEGAFRGLVQYLDAADSEWVVQNIMSLDRSTLSRCAEVVRTLRRLVVHGVEIRPAKRVLAIAFNTTLVPQLPPALVVDAIDILAVFAERAVFAEDAGTAAALSRLAKLVKTHRSGRVRQAAADALFECGVEDEVLETTDWTRSDYETHAQKLKINT